MTLSERLSLIRRRIRTFFGLGCTCGRCTKRWMPLYWVRCLLNKTSFYERRHARRMRAYTAEAGKRLAEEIDRRALENMMIAMRDQFPVPKVNRPYDER